MSRRVMSLVGFVVLLMTPCSATELWDCTHPISKGKERVWLHEQYEVEKDALRFVNGDTRYRLVANNEAGLIATDSVSFNSPGFGPTVTATFIGIDKKTGEFLVTSVYLNTKLGGPLTDRGICHRLH